MFMMRDDSARKVYIHDYNTEKVLYDFTVEPKDTIWVPNPYDIDIIEMHIVDSVRTEFIAEYLSLLAIAFWFIVKY